MRIVTDWILAFSKLQAVGLRIVHRVISAMFASSLASVGLAAHADAQSRSVRETATTYGARLNANAEPENLNHARVNNRVNSRLDTRLSLRIERFRAGDVENPTAAYRAPNDDRSRAAPVIDPRAADPD